MEKLLSIKKLNVFFGRGDSKVHAVRDLNLQIEAGKTVALVGESGSGKSATGLAIMGLLDTPSKNINGEIIFKGQNILALKESQMRKIRGQKISMIFQEPMTSLNPVFTVGFQIAEVFRIHQGLTKAEALAGAVKLLDEVGITYPEQKVNSYPHEMSGGQRQRVMIAMALAGKPDLLIADEPTTALDPEVRKQILALLLSLKKKYNLSLLHITHDMSIVEKTADEVCVMQKGRAIETDETAAVFMTPHHPYTCELVRNRISQLPRRPAPQASNTFLEVRNLSKHFPVKSSILRRTVGWVKAVDGVNFKLSKGRTLGLVGASGSGKTTLGRALLRLIEPTSGEIIFDGQDLMKLKGESLRRLRSKIQIVFQDPYSSLNPRRSVGDGIEEAMTVHGIGGNSKERRQIAGHLFSRVGLDPQSLSHFPHEFSGGQRQRVCIARALSVQPQFIVCDEAVSSLDAPVQMQILNLLLDLKNEFGLTYIFISHDMEVVKYFADDVAVMSDGRLTTS